MSLIEDAKLLRRPKILVRAARFAMLEFRRDRMLRRILRQDVPASPMAVLGLLMHRERELETMRKEQDPSYSVAHHVDALAAVMSELRSIGPVLKKGAPDRTDAPCSIGKTKALSM